MYRVILGYEIIYDVNGNRLQYAALDITMFYKTKVLASLVKSGFCSDRIKLDLSGFPAVGTNTNACS